MAYTLAPLFPRGVSQKKSGLMTGFWGAEREGFEPPDL